MKTNINTFEDVIYAIVLQFQKAEKAQKKVWCQWIDEGLDQRLGV